MKLGFVSAILPDFTLEEVVSFASSEGFSCVELMCWPKGHAQRRYAGVTHVDVDGFDRAQAERVNEIMQQAGVAISGLGYYPNPLAPDRYLGFIWGEVWGTNLSSNHVWDEVPDFLVFRKKEEQGKEWVEVLEAGYFDSNWRIGKD